MVLPQKVLSIEGGNSEYLYIRVELPILIFLGWDFEIFHAYCFDHFRTSLVKKTIRT